MCRMLPILPAMARASVLCVTTKHAEQRPPVSALTEGQQSKALREHSSQQVHANGVRSSQLRSQRLRFRYRTDADYRTKHLAKSYELQMRAGLIVRPSAQLLQKYGLEALAAELGVAPRERPADEQDARRRPPPNITLDLWRSK